MSDDYFFGDEDLDNSAIIAGLEAFEATHGLRHEQETAPAPDPVAPSRTLFHSPPRRAPALAPRAPRPKSPSAEVITISDEDDDEFKFGDSFDLEKTNWEEFDQRVEVQAQQLKETTGPVPGPSNGRQFTRTPSGKLQQQTLWGVRAPPNNKHKPLVRQKGKVMKKTKTWDRTEYAKSGWKVSKKVKNQDDEEPPEEEPVEFEQFPRPTNLGGVFTCVSHVWGRVD